MNFNFARRLKDFLFPRSMETFLSTFYLILLLLLLLCTITIMSPTTADQRPTVESFSACGSLTTLGNRRKNNISLLPQVSSTLVEEAKFKVADTIRKVILNTRKIEEISGTLVAEYSWHFMDRSQGVTSLRDSPSSGTIFLCPRNHSQM